MTWEDYVSFEIAKLLKEKGFDEATFYDYNERGTRWFEEVLVNHNSQGGVACPTLQTAMKWLREVHNIHVVPKFDFYAGNYTGRVYDGRRESTAGKDDYIAIVGNNTYEEAAEAAIKYCLENLI